MKYAEFRDLVRRLEARAQANPTAYRMIVVLWVLLGLVAVAFALFLVLGILGVFVLVVFSVKHGLLALKLFKLAIPIAFVGYVLVKALWVTFPAPEGLRVRRNGHPKLFACIDRARIAVGARAPAVVLINADLNAGVCEQPRFGLLPIYRSYLQLGLPILEAASERELEAILAHEFGHLSRRHGRTQNWIYRMQRLWGQVAAHVEERGVAAGRLVLAFVRWYVPRLRAWAFPLGRQDEFEADRAAAVATSGQTVVDALVRVQLAASGAESRFWRQMTGRVESESRPPRDAFALFAQMLQEPVDSTSAEAQLRERMMIATDYHDTHPALRDRAAALGVEPRVPPRVEESAAQALLTDLDAVRARVSTTWYEQVEARWSDEHRELRRTRREFDELRSSTGGLDGNEHARLAGLALRLGCNDVAEQALSYFVERSDDPRHASAMLRLGELQLESNCSEGVALVERAMATDIGLTVSGSAALANYFRGRDASRYEHWSARYFEASEIADEAARERDEISSRDRLGPHGLSSDEVTDVARHVAGFPQVKRAWLVQKQLEHFPEDRLFVLVIELRRQWAWTNSGRDEKIAAVVAAVAPEVPTPGQCFTLSSKQFAWAKKKAKKIAGSKLL